MSDQDINGYPASGKDGAADDHRRTKILAEVADYFPQGASPKLSMQYIKQLRPFSFTLSDVRGGKDRVIATREQRTFPTFAVFLHSCEAARADRILTQAAEPLQRYDCSAAGKEQRLREFDRLREDVGLPAKPELEELKPEAWREEAALAAKREKKREYEEIGLSLDDLPF